MLKTEFDRIMSLFAACVEGKTVGVEEVFKQALDFFEKVTEVLREGDPAHKKQALEMMSEMYQRMVETSQRLAKDTGLSEEQLAKLSENPMNFSPEQWKAMQASKERMACLTKDLLEALEMLNPNQKELPDQKKNPSPPKASKGKKKGKSDWLKS